MSASLVFVGNNVAAIALTDIAIIIIDQPSDKLERGGRYVNIILAIIESITVNNTLFFSRA